MIVIFSGYNQRAVISFLRTLKKNGIESFCVIASGETDSILKTSYQEKVIYIRKIKQLDLKEITYALELAKKSCDKESMFIAPSTEALNRFLLRYRKRFEGMDCVIPLVEKNMYEMISDKAKFYELCRNRGIQVPLECDLMDVYTEPLIAKPKAYISVDGKIYSPIFLRTEKEHSSFLERHNKENFDFQEILNGGISFYLLFYFSNAGEVFCCSQKNLLQQPDGKSIIAACYGEFHNKKEIVNPYIELFREIGFRGLVMVEVRELRGKQYMIEANPRFWGPSQLFCDAGYNLFEYMLKDYHLIESIRDFPINRDMVYYWSGGVRGRIFENDDCYWHEDGEQIVKDRIREFMEKDIYKREDTIEIYNTELLENLYRQNSKHSNYQVLPSMLKGILNEENLGIKTRSEKERLSYMKKHINFSQKNILDIGGNTGYFSFELLQENVKHIDYYEGNSTHAEFVQTAAKLLNVEDRISVYPEYYLFDKKEKKYDVILCLNVIHHLGDDFKNGKRKEAARKEMIASINQLSECTDILIFQMGFNWKGDPKECLFENGTKKEMEMFIKKETEEFWDIAFIGIAGIEENEDSIVYQEISEKNNQRQDALGEFLNRPLFIMKSKKQKI